jgi:ABC-type nitrate/sulfonate/bicarbonate transport system substrate-binding protein
MCRNLVAGTLDGYCAGEPWNSLAAQAGHGWIAAWSAVQDRGHIEKVLLVRSDFAVQRAEAHGAIVAALHEAAAWCDEPQNRDSLIQLLALRENLNVAPEAIAPALSGTVLAGTASASAHDSLIFHRGGANTPQPGTAAGLLRQLAAHNLVPAAATNDTALLRRLFRKDLFQHATVRTLSHELQRH